MAYTLAEAAKASGLNKTTILRALKSGQITGTKDEHGVWRVHPAEFHRVYPVAARSGPVTAAAQRHAARLAAALAETHQRAILAEQALSDARGIIEELRADRDAWKEQAQRLAGERSRPQRRRSLK